LTRDPTATSTRTGRTEAGRARCFCSIRTSTTTWPSGTLAVRGRDGKLRPGPVGKVAVGDLTKAHRADPVMAHYYEVKANAVTDKALQAGYRALAQEETEE